MHIRIHCSCLESSETRMFTGKKQAVGGEENVQVKRRVIFLFLISVTLLQLLLHAYWTVRSKWQIVSLVKVSS